MITWVMLLHGKAFVNVVYNTYMITWDNAEPRLVLYRADSSLWHPYAYLPLRVRHVCLFNVLIIF